MTITFNQLQAFINFYKLTVDNSRYEALKVQDIRGEVEGVQMYIFVSYGTKRVEFREEVTGKTVTKELI